jgi:anti-sigma B factor antagonist
VSLELCPVDRVVPYATITLPAEVGIDNADQVREKLFRAIEGAPELLIVDMTGTSYCAAAGIHLLLDARGRAGDAGIGLRVAAGAPTVRRTLQLTGADRLIDVYPSLESALTGPAPIERQLAPVAAAVTDPQRGQAGAVRRSR